MKKILVVLTTAAVIALTGCTAETVPESTVKLNGVEYKIIGAERVEARANKRVNKMKNAQGVETNTEVNEQIIVLNGKHSIQINEDGSFTFDGAKQTIATGAQPKTIRLNGDTVTIE